jgi:uncharacterized protein YciI
MVDEQGPYYFVVFHSPGPKWAEGVPYNKQPEFMKHVEYISGLHDKKKIILSGPFMNSPGGLAGELADGGTAADLERLPSSARTIRRCAPACLTPS